MQPSTILFGIVFGSVFAIAFGLAMVMLFYFLLQGEHPRLAEELPELARAVALFTALCLVAATSFWGSLQRTRWRHVSFLVLAGSLAMVAMYYWPE